jgi:hypothetical protein
MVGVDIQGSIYTLAQGIIPQDIYTFDMFSSHSNEDFLRTIHFGSQSGCPRKAVYCKHQLRPLTSKHSIYVILTVPSCAEY